ncbi:hypothetical protein BDZ89DRAFT_1143397 [Hymenopellis radicata]|nr:hypothetical protein BDZ89DRAFT_1143397 [Hymenopellis radicata]
MGTLSRMSRDAFVEIGPFVRMPLDIHAFIFAELDPIDLVRFSQVSKDCRRVYEDYVKMAFSHSKILRPYLDGDLINVDKFVAMQLRTGLVVSGSSALQLLTRTTYPESDLDCYVGSSIDPAAVQDAVTTMESFDYVQTAEDVFSPHLPDPDTIRAFPDMATGGALVFHTDIYGASNIDRVIHMTGPQGQAIKIIVPRYCVMDVVLSSHSTCVMNVLTATKLYCLYAKATLVDELTIVRCFAPNETIRNALEKYEERGFPSISVAHTEPAQECRGMTRYVGDHHCWVLKLRNDAPITPPSASERRKPPPAPMWNNTWQLVRDLRDLVQPAFHLHYTAYRGFNAQTSFIIPDSLMLQLTLYPQPVEA